MPPRNDREFEEWVSSRFRNLRFRRSDGTYQPISFDFTEDGCYAKAEALCSLMEREGIPTAKIWALAPPNMGWRYHVAAVVQSPSGTARVYDATFNDGWAVSTSSWSTRFGGQTRTTSSAVQDWQSVFAGNPRSVSPRSRERALTSYADDVSGFNRRLDERDPSRMGGVEYYADNRYSPSPPPPRRYEERSPSPMDIDSEPPARIITVSPRRRY